MTLRIASTTLLILAIGVLTGCGVQPGTLSGVVKLKGVPLSQGQVSAITDAGASATGEIQPDGTYKIENCPGGVVKIWVMSPDPNAVAAVIADRKASGRFAPDSPALQMPKGDPERWRAIPELYTNPDLSGITVKVSGDTTFDIEMQ